MSLNLGYPQLRYNLKASHNKLDKGDYELIPQLRYNLKASHNLIVE